MGSARDGSAGQRGVVGRPKTGIDSRHCVVGTPAKERRVTRWEHEAVLEAVQRRLDEDPHAMRTRRQTVEHV
ncbi:hypothetical protein MKK49_06910, partial [Methylobacterium sp. J-090]|nr:hypothetical protein [Methylobacterium sp. J-090]